MWKELLEEADKHAVRELYLYATNDGDLYRQMLEPIYKNYSKKFKKDKYDRELAVKGLMRFVLAAAKKYSKDHSTGNDWQSMFPKDVREEVAKEIEDDFYQDAKAGNLYEDDSNKGEVFRQGNGLWGVEFANGDFEWGYASKEKAQQVLNNKNKGSAVKESDNRKAPEGYVWFDGRAAKKLPGESDARAIKRLKKSYSDMKNKTDYAAHDEYRKRRTSELGESDNPEDVIAMDVPLFIRMLEFAREDAANDIDLHDVAERCIDAEGRTLTMDDYESIVGGLETKDQMAESITPMQAKRFAMNNMKVASVHKEDDGWSVLAGSDDTSGFRQKEFKTRREAKKYADKLNAEIKLARKEYPSMFESSRKYIKEAMNSFNVYLNGKKIDSVYNVSDDPEQVKNDLIDHDGYDPDIKVRRRKYK